MNAEPHTPSDSVNWLLKRQPAGGLDFITAFKRDERRAQRRIRCPLCEWRPPASSLWCCTRVDVPEAFFEGCGTVWNTFATRGRCPGCRHQWMWTKCLRCDGWSRHDDWYEEQEGR